MGIGSLGDGGPIYGHWDSHVTMVLTQQMGYVMVA